jgi:cysteine-rich repeat protein
VTVSWDPQPSVGHYILDVFHVTLNVNATQLTLVGALHTAGTSIDVPAEILVAGDFYLFDVIAVRDPNSYILGHLLRSGFPTGTGAGVTGLMRLSSSCGNGVVDPGEPCDTGGNSATCDADCSSAICGDGFVNPAAGETCDNILDSPTCDADCTLPVCGDNHWNRTVEQCDDGNLVSGDGCSSTCRLEHCGDGRLDPFEDCDDGNHINGDGCNAFCVRE